MDWESFYARFREPDFVPGYEIGNRLGGGAFGEVYKARKHSIGKAYAIKFLKIDDDAQRDAVERELDAVRHFAALDHPNLVSIEDLGTVMGVPYVVMGYAGEDTLARRLKQGPLEPREALSYFVQVCRGVLALHDRRLVHFDLKPGNVFLKGDVARVGDYGLSKMMADGHGTLSFGRGTPHYMAPEMLRNRADHRADVYSLGVILYECFARKVPFTSSVPGAIALREDDAPPLFPPEFPTTLRPVVERCLRLAPADRYADVAELLADLGQTARPGDSVRLADDATGFAVPRPTRLAPARAGVADRERASTTSARTDETPATPRPPSEARVAARELTRGAVEVARGMWDGLVTHPVQRARGEATPSDVFEVEGLTTSVPSTPAPGPSAPVTIPVPPPVRGGWLGTSFSSVALGLEVLLALSRALLSGVARFVATGRSLPAPPDEPPRSLLARAGRVVAVGVRIALVAAVLVGLGLLTALVSYKL